jgi:hypothetical membrane protein
MRQDAGLLAGVFASLLLALGIVFLGHVVPGYSQIHQTVSEIGEVGSPARTAFTMLLLIVAFLLLVFARALRSRALRAGLSPLTAYFVICMAISSAGVGYFSFPHPLHNVFGQSELIGYCAPLVMALTWRRDPATRPVALWSAILFGVVLASLGLNLAVLDRDGALWAFERPFYGLVQRSLFASWFVWCVGVCLLLLRRTIPAGSTP